jgi:hypothetical protein
MLLIVGGSKDHNLARLANAAKWRGHPYRVIHTDSDPAPAVSWEPGSPDITINGETFSAKGSSLFMRYDVFSDKDNRQKAAYFDTFRGWAESNPAVGLLNRKNEAMEMNKPRALVWAKEAGFDVPKTYIATDFNRLAEKSAYIAKPVAGGDYTRSLDTMKDTGGQPWIIQEKLKYPELRLFRVGEHFFAFEINSAVIDYRVDKEFTMKEVEPPADLVAAMKVLTDRMGLDYAAADLKSDTVTGKLKFLEINTMPMFTGYDDAAGGRLSDAMVLGLRRMERLALLQDALKTAAPKP